MIIDLYRALTGLRVKTYLLLGCGFMVILMAEEYFKIIHQQRDWNLIANYN